jgi:hypothetical protein
MGMLQVTYSNDNYNIFHSTARVKPQEEKQLELASYQSKKLL